MKKIINPALSLKIKLPLSIVIIVAITLAISIFFTVRSFTTVVTKVEDGHLEIAAIGIGENISNQIRQAGRDMVMAASLPNVLQAIEIPPATVDAPEYTKKRIELSTLFERILNAYGYYNSFYMVNDLGEYIVGTASIATDLTKGADSAPFKEAMRKSGFSIGPTLYSQRIDRIIVPVFLEVVYNGYGGALVSSLHITKIVNAAIQEMSFDGIDPIVFALQDNIISIGQRSDIFLDMGAWVNQLQDKSSGVIKTTFDGVEYSIGFYKVPQTDIYATVWAKPEYMDKPIVTLRDSTIIIHLIALFVIVGCVGYFTIPVTREISHLSDYAKAITDGDDNFKLNTDRQDELGDLSKSLGKMVTKLKDMVETSEAATKAKSDFLACMSHEIRTPMNGILGMTYLAMQANPDTKQMDYLRRIDTAANTLLGVINDILDFSKIEAEKLDINNSTFRISGLLESMQDMLQSKCEQKGITLQFSVDSNVPDVIYSDPLRFAQICINLCSNAIKFTPEGKVQLRVSLNEREKENIVLCVAVKDTGIGIAQEDQGKIFESFAQADGTTTRNYGGTGLGLAISKNLANLLGGDIQVKSVLGKGSTFSFTIRAIEGFDKDLEEKDIHSSVEFTVPNLKILLAEDNEINQEIALEILTNMGAQVKIANNGKEAIELFNNGKFDLILMDIQMPVMDGLTASKEIRKSAHPHAKQIPIIAMTAHAMSGDREKSLQAGLNDHITKPLNVSELYNVLVFWGTTMRKETLTV